MKHTDFKERLEEIQSNAISTAYCAGQDWQKGSSVPTEHITQEATQSLITLFEDYTKAIVGDMIDEKVKFYGKTAREDMFDNGKFWAYKEMQEYCQTINQTSKTILRGQEW